MILLKTTDSCVYNDNNVLIRLQLDFFQVFFVAVHSPAILH